MEPSKRSRRPIGRRRPRAALQRREALQLLRDFGHTFFAEDLNAVLALLVRHARDILRADATAAMLFNEDGSQLLVRAAEGLSASYRARKLPRERIIETIEARANVLYIADVQQLDAIHHDLFVAEGLCSRLSAPLRVNDELLGKLHVYSRTPRLFTSDEGKTLLTLARFGAQAIASAQRYQRELLIKRDLEQAYVELLQTLTELERAQQRLTRTERLRALGELAHSVAHDFNNLLSGILGNTQLLLEEATSEQLPLLKVVEQAALDGRALVSRIRGAAGGRNATKHALVDLEAVVDGALAITRARWQPAKAGVATVIVQREVEPELRVWGNDSELREVLINLIVNALDALPSGGTLTLRAKRCPNLVDPAAPGTILLEVADTGTGIPLAIRDTIFEAFFTTKSPEEGSGLGLAICRTIVEQHGGTISVESEPGSGSLFRITLPEPNAEG